jgi:hypothetical protein
MKVVPISKNRTESIERLAALMEADGPTWRSALLVYYDDSTDSVGFSVAGSATVLEVLSWIEMIKHQLMHSLSD